VLEAERDGIDVSRDPGSRDGRARARATVQKGGSPVQWLGESPCSDGAAEGSFPQEGVTRLPRMAINMVIGSL
jgi:hypothetical protein